MMEKQDVEKRESYHKIGKDNYKRFVNTKLNKSTNVISFITGLLITAIIILPIAILLFNMIELYWYKSSTVLIFLCVAWGILQFANGFSSYVTVRFVQAHCTDMEDIQKLDSKAIFYAQTFNIGFMIVTFLALVALWFIYQFNGAI